MSDRGHYFVKRFLSRSGTIKAINEDELLPSIYILGICSESRSSPSHGDVRERYVAGSGLLIPRELISSIVAADLFHPHSLVKSLRLKTR
jgi:hypothetical protein